MSSKFSRRSTRVQPKPKVCKSPPATPQAPPFPPATAIVSINWSDTWLFPSFTSSKTITNATATWQGSNWQLTGTDDQGHAFTATWTYPIGAPGTIRLDISGAPCGPPTHSFPLGTWNGSLPFSESAKPIGPPCVPGSGSGTTSFAIS